MLKRSILYFLYLLLFIVLLSIRSTFTEVLSCSFIPDPVILMIFLLFDIDIKKYIKYLIIFALSLLYTQFSLGSIAFYFSSFSLLFFVYQKIMKTLNREDKVSVLVTLIISLFVYNLYIYIILFIRSHSFRFDYYLFICDFIINILSAYLVLIYLGLKLRNQND